MQSNQCLVSLVTSIINHYSLKKRASRATALRADGVWHIRGLVLTHGPVQPFGPVLEGRWGQALRHHSIIKKGFAPMGEGGG